MTRAALAQLSEAHSAAAGTTATTALLGDEALGISMPRVIGRAIYPVEALGGLLGEAAREVADNVQAPLEIAAHAVLSVASFVAKGVSRVETNHMKLERNYQKVASINDDMCLNCGKCVMTCNDNGYQAIDFDPVSHIPVVSEEDCTGCGICESVCPALGCIEFIPRTTKDKKSMRFLTAYRGEKKENGDADMPQSIIVKIKP